MSSNEEDYRAGESHQDAKKRRIQRACDICRRKKIRCDGIQMPGNRCSNCISYSFDCTYVEAAKKRGPPKGYVEGLEKRLEYTEKLLRKFCPDEELPNDINASFDPDKWQIDTVSQPLREEYNTEPIINPATSPTDLVTKVIRQSGSPVPPLNDPHDDDFACLRLEGSMKQLYIDSIQHRFFGKSSGAMLVQAAIDLKHEFTGQSEGSAPGLLGARRPEFWTISQWEESSALVENPTYTFPGDDLLYPLIDLYFDHINMYLPLLHRPTFQRSVASGLHRVNSSFGAVVLLVCALGARYSNDPRVLLDGVSTYHSAGWKWFDQVQTIRKSYLVPPTLYDIQFYSLAVQYLLGCSGPQQCWAMIGIGIRVAQDVGAHRRKYNIDNMTVEDEMWKRAFWVLVCLDRMNGSTFGRPCAIQDEDFDIDLPVECDDEYWDHPDPAQRFKQPPNKPSHVKAFIIYIKILQILGLSLRTIYSINKSKVLLGFTGNKWEQHIVAELDSALNKWVDSVPHYLRWDPNREDDRYFNQSAWLYCAYYYIQIIVHKPFIPSVGKPSPLSFPSLAICTNAARSCSHIIDVQSHRATTPSQLHLIAFTSGIVLLLNIWSGKRNGLSTEPAKEMTDVHKCMQVLKRCETRWHPAGRLWDILYELAFVGDLPLPNPSSSPPLSNKRERDVDSPTLTNTSDSNSSSSLLLEGTRTIAGSRRVRESMQQQSPSTEQSLQSQPQDLYTLPVYSEELGRLPVHGQFAFSPQGPSVPSGSHFSSWNHATPHDAHIPGTLSSTTTSASYPLHNTVGGSFTMDGPPFDPTGVNWTFIGERLSSSSLGTTPIPSAGVDLHQMGTASEAGMTGLSNSQAMIDSDAMAMWCNAPSGFDLNEWETYLSNVGELTHGQISH